MRSLEVYEKGWMVVVCTTVGVTLVPSEGSSLSEALVQEVLT